MISIQAVSSNEIPAVNQFAFQMEMSSGVPSLGQLRFVPSVFRGNSGPVIGLSRPKVGSSGAIDSNGKSSTIPLILQRKAGLQH